MSAPTATNNPKQGVSGRIGWAIVGLAIFIAVMYLFSGGKSDEVAETTTSTQLAPAYEPPARCSGEWDAPIKEVGPEGLPIHLCWGWNSWAVDDCYKITDVNGKLLKEDCAGTPLTGLNIRDQTVIFWPKQVGGTVHVAIRNQWSSLGY